MASSETKKKLALAIIDFLNTSTKDGTLSSDETDSIEVATQCISDAFKVDPTDSAAMSDALGGKSLLSIYGVFEKMKSRSTGGSKPDTPPAPTPPSGPSDEDKSAAESLKSQGNTAMASKDYDKAIDLYTQALALVPNNPIYLSNRAAAHSAKKDYDLAIADAQVAVDTDPSYTKAWSRLGHARFAKNDARGAMEAYEAGLAAEGANPSEIMRRGYETAKKRVEEEDAVSSARSGSPRSPGGGGAGGGLPDLAGLASMLGGGQGGGAGGGGGGMPDLGSIMQNPMFTQMAQNLMSNPGMFQNLMSNPRLRQMMDSVGGEGGGMPDLGALMSDPSIADMARNLMGGNGGGGAGGAGTPPTGGAGRGA